VFGKFVSVYVAIGPVEAAAICAFLNSMGIPTTTSQESAGIAYGFTVGPFSKVEIFVPSSLANTAKGVLSRMEQGEFEAIDNQDDLSDEENKTIDEP